MLSLWIRSLRHSRLLMVKTIFPCNGFMAKDVVHGAETRNLIKYDTYLLIRNKLCPHYFVHFFLVHAKHFLAHRAGLFLFCCLTRGDTDQSATHLQRDPRYICVPVCIGMTFVLSILYRSIYGGVLICPVIPHYYR